MKKKRNTTFSLKSLAGNFVFTLFCLLASSFCLWQFWKSFNEALTKLNEKPIATITFKYKTAQRKFIDRVLWDRLRQDSPVYNGDIIRTAPLSEATIWFTDGNIMELYESTMAQVFLKETGVETELSDGSVFVDSSAAETAFKLSASGNTVLVERGTKLNAEQSEELKVLVQEGNAVLSRVDSNKEETLSSGASLVVNQTGQVEHIPSIYVVSPSVGAKILVFNESELAVNFYWKTVDFSDEMAVKLEVAEDKGFKNIVFSKIYTGVEYANVLLKSGTYFYRTRVVYENSTLKNNEEVENSKVSEGKFQILYSPKPELLVPAVNSLYTYKSKNPVVRFVWSENEWATAWELEVADNENMQNPKIKQRSSSPSSIIKDLSEGKWYWRVTPYYAINKVGLANASEVQSFEVKKNTVLNAPRLILPQDNGSLDISTDDEKRFSWKTENEAVFYTIKISKNQDLTSPIFEKTTDTNYVDIHPKTDNITDGIWYWGVTQQDADGNVSKVSDIRTVLAANGKLYQRTIFPPNEYKIAESFIEDINFTWKTNLPFETRYQVARDANFKDIVIDEKANSTTFSGRKLAVGDWYWRIKAETKEQNFTTLAKKFTVLSSLEKPNAISPVLHGYAVIRQNVPYEFKWAKVEGADYYRVIIYDSHKNDEIIYEQNFITETSIEVDFSQVEDGNYRWTVQGFAEETQLSTRRNGLIGEYNFVLKHIQPAKLLYPANRQRIDGERAIKKPGKVKWNCVETSLNTVFYLSKNKNPQIAPIAKIENPGKEIQLRRLQAGTYYWTIKAFTYDNIDLSSEIFSFTVTPVAPLETVQNLTPINKTVFDSEYFRNRSTIGFSWDKVADADNYKVTIFNNKGKVCFTKTTKERSLVIDDLSVFERGTFTWQVEAQNYYENVLFRKSKPVKAEFTIDLPAPKMQKININGVLYGK